jgi:hypothetical protein
VQGISGVLAAVPYLSNPVRYLFLAVALWVAYFLLTLAWIPFRFWASPPVGVSADARGLTFRLRDGRRMEVNWKTESLWIEILKRTGPTISETGAAWRLWIIKSDWDNRLLWRKVVPLVYTTEAEADAVLQAAGHAGMSIKNVETAHSLSMVRQSKRTAFLITSPKAPSAARS